MANKLKTICFAICAGCIGIAAVLIVLAIWGAITSDAVWQCIATLGIIAAAAGCVGGVYSAFFGPVTDKEKSS